MPLPPHKALGLPNPPLLLMLGLSLAQGLVLLWLWRAGAHGDWPSQTPAVNFPLWTVAIVWPGMALLSVDALNLARRLTMTTAFTAIVALLAAYLGWQASPHGEFPLSRLLYDAIASLLVVCFLALMYLQSWAARQSASYDVLFALSWRNFLVLTLAALATVIFWLTLELWAQLFVTIGIEFFQEIFRKNWFLFPVLAVAFGFSTHIFRRLVQLIDGIAGLLEGLMRLLLPLAIGVLTVFLVALPFVGLAPLWASSLGTGLLLYLNGFVLFAINAVYQDGTRLPYPNVVHRLLHVGIATLPVITALAGYGLYLRIDQHGWSVDRCWGVTVCVFFGLFSASYAWHIARRRDAWPVGLASVNRVMGWVILAVALLANSPLLDFRSISLASQWARVESGEIALRDFDFYFVKRELARPGWLKMQELIEKYETADPGLAQAIREAKQSPQFVSGLKVDWARVRRRPESLEVPPGVQEAANDLLDGAWAHGYWPSQRDADKRRAWLTGADLDADGRQDYVLIQAYGNYVRGIHVYDEDGTGAWRSALLAPRNKLPPGTDVTAMLRDGEILTEERTVRDLRIGDLVLGEQPAYGLSEPWVAVGTRED